MDVDAEPDVQKGKKEEKKKGKGKQKNGEEDEEEEEEEKYSLVSGDLRCRACVKDDARCRVNTAALLRWREKVAAGRVTARAPAGTSCDRCNTVLKKPCDLPGTADLREKVAQRKAELAEGKKGKAEGKKEPAEVKKREVRGGSEASGSKRKAVEVEMPPRKKAKHGEEVEKEMSEGEYRKRLLSVLGRVASGVEKMGKLERRVDAIHLDLQLQNVLLQRLVATQEGLVAKGKMPVQEWGWEDEPDVSAEETEEESEEGSEEGSEEESEEGSEEGSEEE